MCRTNFQKTRFSWNKTQLVNVNGQQFPNLRNAWPVYNVDHIRDGFRRWKSCSKGASINDHIVLWRTALKQRQPLGSTAMSKGYYQASPFHEKSRTQPFRNCFSVKLIWKGQETEVNIKSGPGTRIASLKQVGHRLINSLARSLLPFSSELKSEFHPQRPWQPRSGKSSRNKPWSRKESGTWVPESLHHAETHDDPSLEWNPDPQQQSLWLLKDWLRFRCGWRVRYRFKP